MAAAVEARIPGAAVLEPKVARVCGLTVSYGAKPALFSVDAGFSGASMTAVVGPNGAGKSTLLKAMLGIVEPLCGTVEIFGEPPARVLERVAYVPQRSSVDWDFPTCALDVVMMGLYRRLGLMRPADDSEFGFAEECLAKVGMERYADRQIGQLSGGQQQRVFLARSLAQDADLYLLDEPFAGVDASSERTIIETLRALRDDGRTVVVVHHDLSTVPSYFDRVLIVNVSRIAEGSIGDAFTEDNLQAAYGGTLPALQPDGAQREAV